MKRKQRGIKSLIATIITSLFLFGFILTDANMAFADTSLNDDSGGGYGDAHNSDGPGNTGTCTTGNCYRWKQNGAYWVKIPVTANGVRLSKLGFDFVHKDYTVNCYGGEGFENAVYVLVSQLSSGKSMGGVGVKFIVDSGGTIHDFEEGVGTTGDKVAYRHPGEAVTLSDAFAAFEKHADSYAKLGVLYESPQSSSTSVSAFCADDPFFSSTTTTTTTSWPTYQYSCFARIEREWGDTQTRIAVRNVTLDGGFGGYPDVFWDTTGPRSSLVADSWWTDSGTGTLEESPKTIAKPGDSIQFLHEFCAGDRFVRQVPVPGVAWTGDQSHTEIFDIPTNKFKIGANRDEYLFPNGIEWANNEVAAHGSEYEHPFTNPYREGMWVDGYRYGVGTLSPTPDISYYHCHIYDDYDDWMGSGSFQIPGYDVPSGSCSSGDKVYPYTNTVGQTITQYHEFNMVKAWEQWTHDKKGTCGCNSDNSAEWGGRTFSNDYAKPREYWGNRQNWVCDGTSCTNCCYCCGGYYDKYQVWHCTKHCDDRYKYLTPDDFNRQYQSKSWDYGTTKKIASVFVPYNFETILKSSITNNEGIVFQGTSVGSKFDWNIVRRFNDTTTVTKEGTATNALYATVTPPGTTVKMVEFILKPGDESVIGNIKTKKDPCEWYSSNVMCGPIDTKTGNQNPMGKVTGQDNSETYHRVVPDNDEYIGFSYCVAVGIYPSDSHNYMGNDIELQYHYGEEGAMDGGEYWNISNASCRTIAKKPNFQVWNGSVYTEGSITTSLTKKMTGTGFGTYSSADQRTRVFGSWSDYAIIAAGTNKGMSSGAMLGYNNDEYNLSREGGQLLSTATFKQLSPQTTANSEGDSNSATGNSGVNASPSISMNISRLKARYAIKAADFSSGSSNKILTASTGMQYVNYDGSVDLSTLAKHIEPYNDNKHPNQTAYYNAGSKSLVKTLGDGKNDNTLVIYVKGTLTIDTNICLGTCGGKGMKLSDYSFGENAHSGAELPQVLIFADNIDIKENVTRIDAWLLATDGTINTCKVEHLEAADAARRSAYNDYGNCYKTLMVNGPVYASQIKLNRTAGATHGIGDESPAEVLNRQYGATGDSTDANLGSVTPAEIFNLRADSYIWAYNQAQRYSEAVVTYMRELAPRY